MIPKVIHYCWFGGNPLPELAKKCIDSWKKHCPDYSIKEWNENNFDVNCCAYVREAYEAKKWAFVSDYARLYIIYQYGGIYLDTDVELLMGLDDLLECNCFLGIETTGEINTGLGFGAIKNSYAVEQMLNEYNNTYFIKTNNEYDLTPCPTRNTAPFIQHGFNSESREIQRLGDVTIYPPEFFCPMDYTSGKVLVTENTKSIHHFGGTWQSGIEKRVLRYTRLLCQIFGMRVGKVITKPLGIYVRITSRIATYGWKHTIAFYVKRIMKE